MVDEWLRSCRSCVDSDKVGVGVDPEDASNIMLVYLAEKENKLLEVKQVYY